ncbi:glutamate--tRNA ligase [Candidatus Pacearchaeota archaeon]|nr:MAG: glutamate--tRNA ligase [Candidatus Pacearchaeota archaeon]
MVKSIDKKIRGYALKNAIAHNGKAQQGSIVSSLFHEGLEKKDMKKYGKKISEIVQEINNLSLEEQKKEFEKIKDSLSERETREGLPELPDVKKTGVIMRFAPSASGPLHIGHALVASLNILYVNKYTGKFYVRIEDTNPENIYKPAYKMIKKEAKWLSKGIAEIVIQSERMKLYYDYAKKLIEKDKAYVCTCSGDEFRKFAKEKKQCPCRKMSIKENLERWKKMLDKKGFNPGEAVLRFKSDMKHKNPAMRDFPLARINLTKHALQGNKYRVWPLMNLAVSVDDIEMKMTHIIRGKDHRDNALRQKMIFEVFNKKYPWTGFLGRYHFKGMELSTTKFREGIESGRYSGWDDPDLPTIESLRKQGYKPEAFWKMEEHIGISEVDKTLEKDEFFRLLNEFNKE